MKIEMVIRNAISEIFPDEVFEDSDDLIELGVIDSMSILFLVSELEKNFKIEIPMDLILEKHFNSVNSIVALTNNLLS